MFCGTLAQLTRATKGAGAAGIDTLSFVAPLRVRAMAARAKRSAACS